MEVELLHIYHGDKKKNIDTTQPEGRNEVDRLLKNLCEQKCAVFLERHGKKSYRVIGYDPVADKLLVEVGAGKKKSTKPMALGKHKATCYVSAAAAKVAAVAPVAGGVTPLQQALEKAFRVKVWTK